MPWRDPSGVDQADQHRAGEAVAPASPTFTSSLGQAVSQSGESLTVPSSGESTPTAAIGAPDRTGALASGSIDRRNRSQGDGPDRQASAVQSGAVTTGFGWRSQGWHAWFVGLVAMVLGAAALSSRHLITDSYYDLYAGRYIVHHGIPHANAITAVSHGSAWIDQQWLAQVLFYGAWSVGGYRALAFLSIAPITIGFAVLALVMLRRGVPPVRAFAWTTGAFLVCASNIGIRAQSVTYLFLAVIIWLMLEDARARQLRASTWLIIPVLVLWANTHGSALLGIGLVVAYAGYRAVRSAAVGQWWPVLPFLALAGASSAALFCTPYGPRIVTYYRATIGNPTFARYVPEWAPPSLASKQSWAFFGFAAVVLVAVGSAWARGVRPDPVLAGLGVTLLALAVTGGRFEAWFAFGGGLLAADMLARASGGKAPALGSGFRRVVAGLLSGVGIVGVTVLAVTPDAQFNAGVPRRAIEVTAAIAARNPGAKILADQKTSTPLLWLHPSTVGRVAFDVRLEEYSAAAVRDYFNFTNVVGPKWAAMTRGYSVVVSSRQIPWFGNAMRGLRGWRVVYQDPASFVAVRESARLSLP